VTECVVKPLRDVKVTRGFLLVNWNSAMHGEEFQLTDKKPRVPAETFLIFFFVRYPRAVMG
jgi:hypothetical protein